MLVIEASYQFWASLSFHSLATALRDFTFMKSCFFVLLASKKNWQSSNQSPLTSLGSKNFISFVLQTDSFILQDWVVHEMWNFLYFSFTAGVYYDIFTTHMYIQFSRATVTNTPIILDICISHVGAEPSEYILVHFCWKPLECLQNSENLKR